MIMQLHQWSGTIFAIFNQLRGTKHWGIKVTQPKVASLKDHSFTHVCSNSDSTSSIFGKDRPSFAMLFADSERIHKASDC